MCFQRGQLFNIIKVNRIVRIYLSSIYDEYVKDLGGCLGLFHKLCSTNFTVEQLHKKLEFVECLFSCSYNFTFFSRTECVKLKLFS